VGRVFTLVLGWFSLATFLVALGLHVAGYIPGAPLSLDRAQWLHLAAFGCFVAMGAHLSVLQRAIDRRVRTEEAGQAWFARLIPSWVWAVVGPLCVYAFVSAVVHFATQEGQPHVVNGKYALTSHGRVVREVDEQEFRAAQRLSVRGPSGHWMVFSAIPAAYFLVVYPRARAALAAPPELHPN
jgi:hypothetical protein